MAQLMQHTWPGNVRELRNLMERLVIMTAGEVIDARDLPALGRVTAAADGGPARSLAEARRSFERDFLAARLREHGGNIARTAEAVGIARESLSRKLKRLKLEPPRG